MARSLSLPESMLLGLGGAAVLYLLYKGGLANVAKAAGAGAVNAAGAAASGAVGTIGAAVGLPTPDDVTTDPAIARWIIDLPDGGIAVASAWSSAPAFAQALLMPSGSGQPPSPGTAVYNRFASSVIDFGNNTAGW